MSVIERAGRNVTPLPVKTKTGRPPQGAGARAFDLDEDRLSAMGLYTPRARSSQLALELRAVKRRLMRRIGFLRAAGERRAFQPARARNLIMVTSTRAGEGKTFNAVNLALSLALEDQIETLLVDADAPRPKIRASLGLPASEGLTDKMLDPSLQVDDLCWRARQAPLSVLTEGAFVERTAELFGGEASQGLWSELCAQDPARLVIIDAPPALAAAEAVVLARYVDEIVFVVEANATPEPAVASAVDELLDVNPNISLILNRCLIGAGGSHYGSYHYYDQREGVRTAPHDSRQARGASHEADN